MQIDDDKKWQFLKLNKIRIYYLNNTLYYEQHTGEVLIGVWSFIFIKIHTTYVARAAAGKFMHNCDKRER